MKHLVTAALITTALTSPARAFDIDLSYAEVRDGFDIVTVSDLSVGVRGSIELAHACEDGGKLFIYNSYLKTDTRFGFFHVERLPNGEFALDFINNDEEGQHIWNTSIDSITFTACNPRLVDRFGGYFPVATLDGHSTYLDWLDHVASRYNVRK